MKLHDSLVCSKQPSTSPLAVPHESSSHPYKFLQNYFNIISLAMSLLMWLFTGHSPRRPRLNGRPIRVGFVMEKLTLGGVLFQVFRVLSVSIIPPALHTRLSNTDAV